MPFALNAAFIHQNMLERHSSRSHHQGATVGDPGATRLNPKGL
ncbi:hypothetical protein NBRC111894_2011 [Sporolactobacillus inulinus]|uniref:Uncharacterized protein n=1 Tax=Sporolactobacillus inulinus TaxID=2078 RepID=A0A4Y1ZBL5_9BACL|nr:hypothetical protein NBRC111894_2011 [Sporolactobacillus inulinus]